MSQQNFDLVKRIYAQWKAGLPAGELVDPNLDEVVVIGVARGTSASGVEAQWRQGYIWTVRDGCAVRFRWFNDPAEALEAVGLEQ